MSGEEKLVKYVKLLYLQRLTKFVVFFFFVIQVCIFIFTCSYGITPKSLHVKVIAQPMHDQTTPLVLHWMLWWCSPVVVIVSTCVQANATIHDNANILLKCVNISFPLPIILLFSISISDCNTNGSII